MHSFPLIVATNLTISSSRCKPPLAWWAESSLSRKFNLVFTAEKWHNNNCHQHQVYLCTQNSYCMDYVVSLWKSCSLLHGISPILNIRRMGVGNSKGAPRYGCFPSIGNFYGFLALPNPIKIDATCYESFLFTEREICLCWLKWTNLYCYRIFNTKLLFLFNFKATL